MQMPMTKDEFTSGLGQGFHTGLRKVVSSPDACAAWDAIDRMEQREWHAVLEFVASGFESIYGLEWKDNNAS